MIYRCVNVKYFKGLADQKKPKKPDEAILDGQQRLVSMIKVKEKETELAFNIDTEEFEVYNKVKHKTNPIWIQVYDGLNDDPHATLQKLSKQLSITPGEADNKYYTKLNCEDRIILADKSVLLCEKMNKIIELNNSNNKDIDNFIDKMMLQLIMEIDTLIYKYNSSL